jgi:hypothetical protein
MKAIAPGEIVIESAAGSLPTMPRELLLNQIRGLREYGPRRVRDLQVRLGVESDLEMGYLLGLQAAREVLGMSGAPGHGF